MGALRRVLREASNMTSDQDPGPDLPAAPTFAMRHAHVQEPAQAFACPPGVAVAAAAVGLVAVIIGLGAGSLSTGARIAAGVVALAIALIGPGFVVVAPNESRV